MEKKQDVIKIEQDISDTVQINDRDNSYVNNTIMSTASNRFHQQQGKYLSNRLQCSNNLELNNQHNPIPIADNAMIDLEFNKLAFPTTDGLKENKQLQNFQQVIESNLSENTKQRICRILREVSTLSTQEKLFLYLRLPPENTDFDPFRHPQNPLGSRSEINETITWVRSHLKHDPKVSIPKQDVYNDYTAYCTRLDIKPLSTADFGKVMKQVFPEIKPRRLGTRGHSRYCYAAMRKATKLSPPTLQKMKTEPYVPIVHDDINNDSWQIIKTWSEELLNATFQNINELSSYISKHNLNAQQYTSKMLFQKKKLQREIKSKRKYSESLTSKKRRKKRTKMVSCSESFQKVKNTSESIVKMSPDKIEKNEKGNLIDAPMMPINLTSEGKAFHIDATTTNEKNISPKNPANKTSEENVLFPTAGPATNSTCNFPDIKEEYVEEYNTNILCKKVRQAQQSKGLWVPPTLENNLINNPNYVSNDNFLMGPPTQHHPHNLTSFSSHLTDEHGNKKPSYNFNNETASTVISKNSMQLYAKKHRFMQQNKTDGHIIDSENVLPENLGLPRERVISICNMDKHELDDYLNGDNSQEQEAELLQYFQPEDGHGNENSGHGQSTGKSNTNSGEDAVEITQLRHYLHQNFQNNKNIDSINQKLQNQPMHHHHNVPYAGGSASASLAIMSQRHLNNRNDPNSLEKPFNAMQRRKITLPMPPRHTNSKRRNFNFVPISINNNITNDMNKFVSPKSKYNAHNMNMPESVTSTIDFNLSDPMIGANSNIVSASAPPSPSIMHQNPITTVGNQYLTNITNSSSNCNFNEMLEYRSRSVPLNNNGSSEFQSIEPMTGFLSTCNSVTPTPIPTEFNDFNEPLLEFFHPNQIEDVPLLGMNIPLEEKISNERRHLKNLTAEKSDSLNFSRSNPCTPLPISIANSGVDLYCDQKLNDNSKIYESSKSVPSTPGFIGNHLRYSPEMINDCLINNDEIIAIASTANTEPIINTNLFKAI